MYDNRTGVNQNSRSPSRLRITGQVWHSEGQGKTKRPDATIQIRVVSCAPQPGSNQIHKVIQCYVVIAPQARGDLHTVQNIHIHITTATVQKNSKLTQERSTLGADGGIGIIGSGRVSTAKRQRTKNEHGTERVKKQGAE